MPRSKIRLQQQDSSFLLQPPLWFRRLVNTVILSIGTILVINALAGDNGLIELLNTRNKHAILVSDLSRLRAENESLRKTARRLQEDPGAIEEIAKEELGLIKPGELLLIFTNDHPKHSDATDNNLPTNTEK